MSTFALLEIEGVKGVQRFVKLKKDNICPFDEFEKAASLQYPNEITQMYVYMNEVANLKSLPFSKFHPYDNGTPREYEFKTKHLRVYAIEQPNSKVIIIGGMKSQQEKDEKKFRRLKKAYLKSLKK
jgi:hypothetical protein